MAGEWRITQTSCGLIVSFMRDEDLLNFQEVDVGNVLGVEATGYSFSSLDTYRQVNTDKEKREIIEGWGNGFCGTV